jgi:hypothetical protein
MKPTRVGQIGMLVIALERTSQGLSAGRATMISTTLGKTKGGALSMEHMMATATSFAISAASFAATGIAYATKLVSPGLLQV